MEPSMKSFVNKLPFLSHANLKIVLFQNLIFAYQNFARLVSEIALRKQAFFFVAVSEEDLAPSLRYVQSNRHKQRLLKEISMIKKSNQESKPE